LAILGKIGVFLVKNTKKRAFFIKNGHFLPKTIPRGFGVFKAILGLFKG
jgi:hypothetical protein